MIDLTVLNPQQRAAVEHTGGPLLILAGAGSGKTRALTYRVAYLIEHGTAPWKILAITFTNKAAREMKDRICSLAGAEGEEVWAMTFHALCVRILRRDIEKLGYKRQFVIYDEDDSMRLIKDSLKKLNLDEKHFPPRSVRAVISNAKNHMLTPKEWLEQAMRTDPDIRNQRYYDVYERYEKELRGNNALDFDDLLLRTLELFAENPPVLQYYQDRFEHVLVDEYQDTNYVQYQLVLLLAGYRKNICVVGDDDQSIYGWRGADIRNILGFETDFPDARVIKLEQNYRSTGNILDAANQVIAHNLGRKEKALWTESGAGEPIVLADTLDERDEAAVISNQTRGFIREGVRPGQIAVLYRMNAQSRVIEEAFVRAGIPYRVYGGLKFYDRKEVRDLMAYLRAIYNQDDDLSARRIINEPRRGIGEATVTLLSDWAAQNGISFLNAALSAEDAPLGSRARKQIGAFANLMVDLVMAAGTQSPSELLQTVIDRTGYLKELEQAKTEENQARIENIRELQGAVTEFEQLHPDGSLSDFLENVALVTDYDAIDENGGAVTLMTLHAAKGLEFDVVFMPGMEEGIFPTTRALTDPESLEEERRLAYVGITRARKRLFLLHAYSRAIYNSRSSNELSRFVSEIPPRLLRSGSRRGEVRRVPPAGMMRSAYVQIPARPDSRAEGSAEAAGSKGALRVAGTNASPEGRRDAVLFKTGESVVHSIFKRGRVIRTEMMNGRQKVRVQFPDGKIREFDAGIAPLVKVED